METPKYNPSLLTKIVEIHRFHSVVDISYGICNSYIKKTDNLKEARKVGLDKTLTKIPPKDANHNFK